MIKITVELYPLGRESGKKTLGTAVIFNDATGTLTRGNYKAVFNGKRKKKLRSGEVKNFPRLQKDVWDLLYLALEDAVGERNAVG